MFIASVVCGHSKDYGRSKDRGLKRPPFREDSSSKLFDSIHSAPDDPSYGMWVVWQNAQAYPRYVVTYRSKCKQGSATSRSTAAQGLLRTLYGGSGGAATTMTNALINASLPPPPPQFAPWDEISRVVDVPPTIAEVCVACSEGDLVVLAAFWKAGGDPNTVDVNGDSLAKNKGAPLLFIAARQGHVGLIDALLESGADVDQAKANGCTPLFIAAENGHLAVVTKLIAAGALVDKARTTDGSTALLTAAWKGHLTVVTKLIAAGALVDKRRTPAAPHSGSRRRTATSPW